MPSSLTAEDIARALGGRRSGRGFAARCPAHLDKRPSLSITDKGDKVLVHCFAGCEQNDVIAELRERGLWPNTDWQPTRRQRVEIKPDCDDDERRKFLALQIWNAAVSPAGTIAESYLNSRKLHLTPELCGTVLRFHPACPWQQGQKIPALVAAFRDIGTDIVTAIHRIRLDEPERWPKVERKMFGPVSGAAVKLDPVGTSLFVGEGIETCMAARQRYGRRPVWALGSANSIAKLTPIAGVEQLTILGENDKGTNRKAAMECKRNWRCDVSINRPRRIECKDFNDLLMGD